jgi:hypothetical protein
MENKDFAAFILTHGRPDNVKTFKTLKKCGYTGKIYFIVDNEDKSIDKYIENFGIENVKVFNKKEMADSIDEGNNFDNRKVIIHARNYCFKLAKELNITYFIQLDDDYGSFLYRNEKHGVGIKNIDKILDLFIDFYKKTNILSIAFSQGGDHIGGFSGIKLKRKCMNSFICSTLRPFQFIGSINEDVNTYTTIGGRGNVFMTIPFIQLDQKKTQTNKGGMTDIYLQGGTYIKSFYSLLSRPDCVKINLMGRTDKRMHHSISWDNAVPVIIDEKHKK